MSTELTGEQQDALDGMIRENKQIMVLTGSAGTGKSVVSRAFTKQSHRDFIVTAEAHAALQSYSTNERVVLKQLVVNLEGGKTSNGALRAWLKKLDGNQPVGIVIDEAFLLNTSKIEELDNALRNYRGMKSRPFGNVHILFVGDPHQLQPLNGDCISALEYIQKAPTFELTYSHRHAPDHAQFLKDAETNGAHEGSEFERWMLCRRRTHIPENAVILGSTRKDVAEATQSTHPSAITLAPSLEAETAKDTKNCETCTVSIGEPVIIVTNPNCKETNTRWTEGGTFLYNGLTATFAGVDVGAGAAVGSGETVAMTPKNGVMLILPNEENIVTLAPVKAFPVDGKAHAGTNLVVPIRRAGAMTVHSAQGSTMPRVHFTGSKRIKFTHALVAAQRVPSGGCITFDSRITGLTDDTRKRRHDSS